MQIVQNLSWWMGRLKRNNEQLSSRAAWFNIFVGPFCDRGSSRFQLKVRALGRDSGSASAIKPFFW
jgi:hypothetical protein